MNWAELESNMGEDIPSCIKTILKLSGFDTKMSLRRIKSETIEEIEQFVNSYANEDVRKYTCSHSKYYNQNLFKFLPAHRLLLLDLPNFCLNNQNNSIPSRSFTLNEMVKTSLINANKSNNNFEYNDFIRFFAIYVFLLCGRACYQFLCQNLPLPSVSTIRKIFLNSFYSL